MSYSRVNRAGWKTAPYPSDQDALFPFLHLHPSPRYTAGLFHHDWTGRPIWLLGVYAQALVGSEGQTSILAEPRAEDWRRALAAVDKIREKYGDDGIVSLAAGMNAGFRARVHENPENLPGKEPK